jgi:hypothetical protein
MYPVPSMLLSQTFDVGGSVPSRMFGQLLFGGPVAILVPTTVCPLGVESGVTAVVQVWWKPGMQSLVSLLDKLNNVCRSTEYAKKNTGKGGISGEHYSTAAGDLPRLVLSLQQMLLHINDRSVNFVDQGGGNGVLSILVQLLFPQLQSVTALEPAKGLLHTDMDNWAKIQKALPQILLAAGIRLGPPQLGPYADDTLQLLAWKAWLDHWFEKAQVKYNYFGGLKKPVDSLVRFIEQEKKKKQGNCVFLVYAYWSKWKLEHRRLFIENVAQLIGEGNVEFFAAGHKEHTVDPKMYGLEDLVAPFLKPGEERVFWRWRRACNWRGEPGLATSVIASFSVPDDPTPTQTKPAVTRSKGNRGLDQPDDKQTTGGWHVIISSEASHQQPSHQGGEEPLQNQVPPKWTVESQDQGWCAKHAINNVTQNKTLDKEKLNFAVKTLAAIAEEINKNTFARAHEQWQKNCVTNKQEGRECEPPPRRRHVALVPVPKVKSAGWHSAEEIEEALKVTEFRAIRVNLTGTQLDQWTQVGLIAPEKLIIHTGHRDKGHWIAAIKISETEYQVIDSIGCREKTMTTTELVKKCSDNGRIIAIVRKEEETELKKKWELIRNGSASTVGHSDGCQSPPPPLSSGRSSSRSISPRRRLPGPTQDNSNESADGLMHQITLLYQGEREIALVNDDLSEADVDVLTKLGIKLVEQNRLLVKSTDHAGHGTFLDDGLSLEPGNIAQVYEGKLCAGDKTEEDDDRYMKLANGMTVQLNDELFSMNWAPNSRELKALLSTLPEGHPLRTHATATVKLVFCAGGFIAVKMGDGWETAGHAGGLGLTWDYGATGAGCKCMSWSPTDSAAPLYEKGYTGMMLCQCKVCRECNVYLVLVSRAETVNKKWALACSEAVKAIYGSFLWPRRSARAFTKSLIPNGASAVHGATQKRKRERPQNDSADEEEDQALPSNTDLLHCMYPDGASAVHGAEFASLLDKLTKEGGVDVEEEGNAVPAHHIQQQECTQLQGAVNAMVAMCNGDSKVIAWFRHPRLRYYSNDKKAGMKQYLLSHDKYRGVVGCEKNGYKKWLQLAKGILECATGSLNNLGGTCDTGSVGRSNYEALFLYGYKSQPIFVHECHEAGGQHGAHTDSLQYTEGGNSTGNSIGIMGIVLGHACVLVLLLEGRITGGGPIVSLEEATAFMTKDASRDSEKQNTPQVMRCKEGTSIIQMQVIKPGQVYFIPAASKNSKITLLHQVLTPSVEGAVTAENPRFAISFLIPNGGSAVDGATQKSKRERPQNDSADEEEDQALPSNTDLLHCMYPVRSDTKPTPVPGSNS